MFRARSHGRPKMVFPYIIFVSPVMLLASAYDDDECIALKIRFCVFFTARRAMARVRCHSRSLNVVIMNIGTTAYPWRFKAVKIDRCQFDTSQTICCTLHLAPHFLPPLCRSEEKTRFYTCSDLSECRKLRVIFRHQCNFICRYSLFHQHKVLKLVFISR